MVAMLICLAGSKEQERFCGQPFVEVLPGLNVVASTDLHLLHVLLCILLRMSTAVADGIDNRLADLRGNITAWTTKVKIAIALVDHLIDELLLLLQSVCDIDLLLLLSAESQVDLSQHALLVVLIEVLLVAVLLSVASTEEKGHWSTLLACPLRCHTLLNEGSHWRNACAEADHDHWCLVRLWHCHRGGVHLGIELKRAIGSLELTQPAGGETNAVAAASCSPFILDDAKVALLLATQPWRGCNGVQTRLDVGHVVEEVTKRWNSTWVLLEQLCIGVALCREGLVGLLAFSGADQLELFLLLWICGLELQHLIETSLWPSTNVQNVPEQGRDGDHLWQRL
mmetsp:Transcript_50369/g.119758  ORF Transcript_50369/g.119758 Transcript_50369/m.119758 type:complete len:340 (-) Transcript_50369:4557-5576(-)